jgi:hypothetical protein
MTDIPTAPEADAPVPSWDLLTCRDAIDGVAGLLVCSDSKSVAAPTPRQVAAILYVIAAHMAEAMADLGLPTTLA